MSEEVRAGLRPSGGSNVENAFHGVGYLPPHLASSPGVLWMADSIISMQY